MFVTSVVVCVFDQLSWIGRAIAISILQTTQRVMLHLRYLVICFIWWCECSFFLLLCFSWYVQFGGFKFGVCFCTRLKLPCLKSILSDQTVALSDLRILVLSEVCFLCKIFFLAFFADEFLDGVRFVIFPYSKF